MSLKVVEREYKCTKCGAIDHWKEVENEINPPVLNCWNCHAGQGMDVGKQLETRTGMFPTQPPEPIKRNPHQPSGVGAARPA